MTNKTKNRILDLDALNPSIGDVKLGGKKYKMFQPAYEDFIMLPVLFNELGKMDTVMDEDGKEETMNKITKMREIVKRIIPDLDQNILTFAQLMRIVEYVSEKFAEQMNEQYDTDGSDKGK